VKPLVCNYFLTFESNDTCEYSEYWQKDDYKGFGNAELADVKKNLTQLKLLGVNMIDLKGEPLLHPAIPEILRISKRLGFFNVVNTNGILYEDMAKNITGLVDQLLFSVDSANAEEHDRIHGTACFEYAINGLKAAKKLGKLPIINFTVTRGNIQELPEMVELAEDLGVLLWINPVYNWFGLEGFDRGSIGYISRYFGRKNVVLNLASLELLKEAGNNIKRPVCRAGSAVLTIFPDNTLVSPCAHLRRSAVKVDDFLTEILKRREVMPAIALHGRNERCKGCMSWSYLNPSFLRIPSPKAVLAAYSIFRNFLKEINLKKGANLS
jgi:MoaA/NifB/PqqE/SkfB family radical SAM enzyme